MSQIDLITLTESWTALHNETTVESDKLYYIQNRGSGYFVACEGNSEPTTQEGLLVAPRKILKYKKGSQDLYLRSFSGNCAVNISDEG